MAPRPTTQLKDAIVLAYLRRLLNPENGVMVRPRCPDIRDAIREEEGWAILNNEEVYNSLLRLEAAGEVKRTTVTSRTVGWEATRPDSLLVREPVRQLRQ